MENIGHSMCMDIGHLDMIIHWAKNSLSELLQYECKQQTMQKRSIWKSSNTDYAHIIGAYISYYKMRLNKISDIKIANDLHRIVCIYNVIHLIHSIGCW